MHDMSLAIRDWLAGMGRDPDDPALARTPLRFTEALAELTRGTFYEPGRHLKVTFPAEADEMIVLRHTPFVSLCEHHLMPFSGLATLGYIPAPGAGVVGMSKLARVLDDYARRLQLQERLTREVADCIETGLDTLGVAVTITAVHACVTFRGARKDGTELVTSDTRGAFRADPATRAEFFALARNGG
jgi:GTP cyclohydrolase I